MNYFLANFRFDTAENEPEPQTRLLSGRALALGALLLVGGRRGEVREAGRVLGEGRDLCAALLFKVGRAAYSVLPISGLKSWRMVPRVGEVH